MKVEWVSRPCPLCGPDHEARLFAESTVDLDRLDGFAFASRKLPEYMHGRLLECCRCGILYVNPALSLDTLATAYQAAEFDSGDEAGYASRTYARELRRILPRLPDLDEALDIGTGDGAFLEELLALQFSSVHGVEPSEAPIESAKAHIKPLIHSGLFQPQMFSPASFSLVTCFQTMEHVWSPLDLVRGAFGLLKPGGAVAIVIHNRHALSAKVLGMKSPIFDVEHLQLFCPSTGKRLLEEAGFRDVTVSAFCNRYPIRYWAKLLPLSDNFKRPLVRLLSESAAGMFPVAIPAGNLICVGFK